MFDEHLLDEEVKQKKTKFFILLLGLGLMAAGGLAAANGAFPAIPTPGAVAQAGTATPSATPVPDTDTPTPSAQPSATPTLAPTRTPRPSATPTPTEILDGAGGVPGDVTPTPTESLVEETATPTPTEDQDGAGGVPEETTSTPTVPIQLPVTGTGSSPVLVVGFGLTIALLGAWVLVKGLLDALLKKVS